MTETPKKKSRNELIRETVGVYLKHKNYVPYEKYRKSDFVLTQNKGQFIFNKMVEKDLSKVNSFLYSNVLCLTKNHSTVDQQFTKFVKFVESQKPITKTELSLFFGPLICHLYIELLKGREWKPAMEFLKKNAHLIATVKNYSAPLPNKVNGCSVAGKVHEDPAIPAVTTQILFTPESTGHTVRDHFKNIIQTLSTCLRSENLESIESIAILRSSKYEIEVHMETLNALRNYLGTQGHLIILNVFSKWIDLEIVDLKEIQDSSGGFLEIQRNLKVPGGEIKEEILENHTHLDNGLDSIETKPINLKSSPEKKTSNSFLRRLKHSVAKIQRTEQPARSFLIDSQGKTLTSASVDNLQCHIVAGFENSLVKVWQLNQSTFTGRHLYQKQCTRYCEWQISGNAEEIDDDDEDVRTAEKCTNSIKVITGNEPLTEDANDFDDTGGTTLYGHNRGVTDVLLSKQHPILLTTSKDKTMRLWKSSTYKCAAIYRGHNYPIWCCSESPLGQYVATGSKDLTARLWTLEREFPLLTYVGHTQDVDCVSFHPNGNYIATGSCDLSVRLWCVTSGRLYRVFTDCKFAVTKIAFSPDGKFLAAGGDETKIRIFDLAAGSQLTELKDHTSTITDMAWNHNGKMFASSCSDGSIRLWDVTKLGTNESKSGSNKFLWCMNTASRPVKIFFNSLDMISSISSH